MKLPAQPAGGRFEKCPAGTHLAVCYEVIDMGTHEEDYDDGPSKKHKVWIGWETPMELNESGVPFVIGRQYTLSSHERSSLRKDLESWRGRAFSDEDFGSFEIGVLIGKACFLSVVHKTNGERTYANIASVSSLPKGTQTPELINTPVTFDLDPALFSQQTFQSLSPWMQEKISATPEYRSVSGAKQVPQSAPTDEGDDDPAF